MVDKNFPNEIDVKTQQHICIFPIYFKNFKCKFLKQICHFVYCIIYPWFFFGQQDDDEAMNNDSYDIDLAIAMGKEDLLDFQLSEDTNTSEIEDMLQHLKDVNKTISRLFKKQKHSYKELLSAIQEKEDTTESLQDLWNNRLEIFRNMKLLVQLEDGFYRYIQRNNISKCYKSRNWNQYKYIPKKRKWGTCL